MIDSVTFVLLILLKQSFLFWEEKRPKGYFNMLYFYRAHHILTYGLNFWSHSLKIYILPVIKGGFIYFPPQLAAAAEIDEEPVSKAKQSRSEKKARKVTHLKRSRLVFLRHSSLKYTLNYLNYYAIYNCPLLELVFISTQNRAWPMFLCFSPGNV